MGLSGGSRYFSPVFSLRYTSRMTSEGWMRVLFRAGPKAARKESPMAQARAMPKWRGRSRHTLSSPCRDEAKRWLISQEKPR